MKRFLWLVVALATMVLVGCSNNAGGGTESEINGSLNDENWWIGTWQGKNSTAENVTVSQKLEINANGSWKLYLTDVSSGVVYDYYSDESLVISSTGYSVKGTYEMQYDDFSWEYEDGTTEVFGAGLYLKTDPRIGNEGQTSTKFNESRFFYDENTRTAFFLTGTKGQKDTWTKIW